MDNKAKHRNKNTKMNTKTRKSPKLGHIHMIFDDIVYFELKGRGKTDEINAMVSLDKWDYVSKYDWYLDKAGYPFCYQIGMHLHRFIYTYILGETPPSGMHVDHIDRNKLNNTNNNLRLATPQENSFNRTSKSNMKGVRKISENNYTATAMKDGIKHEIKNISSESQAAAIYNLMAEELYGSFAAFNEIK